MSPAADPTISVIIPAYNHEAFVGEALDSVLKQSYTDFELIVIDDGSTDATAVVVENSLRNASRPWRFVRQANQGAHQAINSGLQLAHGEFLTILNSDDFYHPERLQRFVTAARGTERRLLFSRVSYVDERGRALPEDHPEQQRYRQSLQDSELFPTRSFELLRRNVAVTSGNLFFHRSLYREIGGFRPLRLCHDWDFLLRALLFEEPVWLDEPLMSYRLHGANAIVRENQGNRLGAEETGVVLKSYFHGAQDPINPLAPAAVNWGEYWVYFRYRFLNFVDPCWVQRRRDC